MSQINDEPSINQSNINIKMLNNQKNKRKRAVLNDDDKNKINSWVNESEISNKNLYDNNNIICK